MRSIFFLNFLFEPINEWIKINEKKRETRCFNKILLCWLGWIGAKLNRIIIASVMRMERNKCNLSKKNNPVLNSPNGTNFVWFRKNIISILRACDRAATTEFVQDFFLNQRNKTVYNIDDYSGRMEYIYYNVFMMTNTIWLVWLHFSVFWFLVHFEFTSIVRFTDIKAIYNFESNVSKCENKRKSKTVYEIKKLIECNNF